MNKMNRRNLLQTSAIGFATWLSGCQRSRHPRSTTTKRPAKTIGLSPTVKRTPNGWELEVIVTNEDDWDASFRDVRMLAYAANGTKVCEAKVGNLTSSGNFQRTVEVTCSGFPTIITATAKETPCENAFIPVLQWTGTKKQRNETVEHGEWPWEKTYRKCDEELPPERVVKRANTTSTDEK